METPNRIGDRYSSGDDDFDVTREGCAIAGDVGGMGGRETGSHCERGAVVTGKVAALVRSGKRPGKFFALRILNRLGLPPVKAGEDTGTGFVVGGNHKRGCVIVGWVESFMKTWPLGGLLEEKSWPWLQGRMESRG